MNYEEQMAKLKVEWTDQYVQVHNDHPTLSRFKNTIGRVVTVNGNLDCIVDFQDGGWYDVAPSQLVKASDQQSAASRYQAKKNSAQRVPVRQG